MPDLFEPDVVNGKVLSVSCAPVHVRPGATTQVATVRLVALVPAEGPVPISWKATATNVGGVMTGSFHIPVAGNPVDVSRRLAHEHGPASENA